MKDQANTGRTNITPKLTLERAEELARAGAYAFVYQIEQALRDEGLKMATDRTKTLHPSERAKLHEILKARKQS